MYIIVLVIFILKLQTSVSQYPNHLDFQKVGEVIFNNEKYNILKPTTHVVSDYFKEFMLRQGNENFPTKRVFMDNNGFRHFWTGFGKDIKNLRKTDDINTDLINNTKDSSDSDDNVTVSNDSATSVGHKNLPDSGEKNNEMHEKFFEEEVIEDYESTTVQDFLPIIKSRQSEKEEKPKKEKKKDGDTTKKSKKAKKDDTETKTDSEKKEKEEKAADKKKKDETGKEDEATKKPKTKAKSDRVVAKTTFFCPFFGVITMAAFID